MICYELRLVYLWFVWFDGDKNGMMIEYVYGTSTTYNQWEHQEPNMEVAEAYFSRYFVGICWRDISIS